MLEELALQTALLPDEYTRLLDYGLVILGGIIGGASNRSQAEIGRPQYFALSGLIFLCVSAVSFATTAFIVQALAGGFFWVIVALEIFATVLGGFFVARIAASRSRNAYGHARMAPLAFIPIANFWLLLTPSKNEASASLASTIPFLRGGLGVLSGFLMFAASIGISAYATVEGTKRVNDAAAAGVFNEVMLDRALSTMAVEVLTPQVVDEATTLLRIEARGSELRFVYEVDPPLDFLPADMRIRLVDQNCAYGGLTEVIDAGAVISHVYLRKDRSEIGVVEVTRQACGR